MQTTDYKTTNVFTFRVHIYHVKIVDSKSCEI